MPAAERLPLSRPVRRRYRGWRWRVVSCSLSAIAYAQSRSKKPMALLQLGDQGYQRIKRTTQKAVFSAAEQTVLENSLCQQRLRRRTALVPAMSLACGVGASVLRQGRRAGSLCAVHPVTLALAFACSAPGLLGTIDYLERWLAANSTGKISVSVTPSRWVSAGWRPRRWWHSPKPSTR